MNKRWVQESGIDFEEYDITDDYDFLRLFEKLKFAYAEYRGWDDDYWYEDDDHLYTAESEAYEVINELKERL